VFRIGEGEWNPESRSSYNLYDPVARSTVPVYPGGWSAVYVYPDNPGIWNLRSQNLESWYLGEELYVRVYDADPNPAKEKPPPQNLLLCGQFIVKTSKFLLLVLFLSPLQTFLNYLMMKKTKAIWY